MTLFFFFSSRRRHTRYWRDWSSDVCSSDLFFVKRPGPGFNVTLRRRLFRRAVARCNNAPDRLIALGPEHVAEAADGADLARMRGLRLYLLADAIDAHVDGAVERIRIAGIGKVEEAVAGEHALRVVREGAQQRIFRAGQDLLRPRVVAQAMGVEIEPLGADADGVRGGLLRHCGGRRRAGRRATTENRADAGHELAQLAGLR